MHRCLARAETLSLTKSEWYHLDPAKWRKANTENQEAAAAALPDAGDNDNTVLCGYENNMETMDECVDVDHGV